MDRMVVFAYPARHVGGAQILFYRLAKEFALRGYKVGLIDFADGWIHSKLEAEEVDYHLFPFSGRPIISDFRNSIVIMPSSFMRQIDKYITRSADPNIFFWNIHPYNQIPLLPLIHKYLLSSQWFERIMRATVLRGAYKFSKKLVDLAEEHASICYMDIENYEVTRKLSDHVSKRFLPIPIDDAQVFEKNSNTQICTPAKLVAGWLGRLDANFKIYSLERVLLDVDRNDQIDEFHIIGDGEGREYIENVISDLNTTQVIIHGTLDPDQISSYFSSWHIAFSMGTSALETARCGIATILLGYAHRKISDNYKYQWLYETDGYSLGRNIDLMSIFNGVQLSDILQSEIRLEAEKCRLYVQNHHSLGKVVDLLEIYLEESRLKSSDLMDVILANRSLATRSFYRVWINKVKSFMKIK